MPDKKHILVPRGFQNKQLLRAERGINHDAADTPANGECMMCRGTGAIPHKVWLEDFEIREGRIVKATPKMAFFRCKCYKGQFWRSWNPVNIEAIIMPKWQKELNEMKEKEKELILRESGGNYIAGTDTFLKHLEYKPPVENKNKIFSMDEIVRKSMQKKGDLPS